MPVEKVHEVAQGRVWTGRQGVERGLVDDLGGLRRSLDATKRRLGVDIADKVTVVTYGEPLSWAEEMLLRSLRDGGMAGIAAKIGLPTGAAGGFEGSLGATGGAIDLLGGGLVATLREDGTLAAASMLDGRPLALLPMSIRMR
jgi:ClpP class serine protease